MSLVVHTDFDPYSTVPSWTLTLSCGHIVMFKTSKGDTQTRPPTTFDCALCAANKQKKEDEIMSDKIPAMIGMIAMFDCASHVCDRVAEGKSRWIPIDAKTIKCDTEPLGYRTAGIPVFERARVGEVLLKDPHSHERFTEWTEAKLKDFLAANVVDASEAIDTAQTNGKNDMATKTKTVKTKTVKTERVKAPKVDKPAKVKQHNRSRVLRWLGSIDASIEGAKKMTEHLQLGEIGNGWYVVGMKEGKEGKGPIPVFADGEEAEWKKIAL